MDMSAPDNSEQLDASMQLLLDAYSASHVQRARLDAQDIRILAMAYAVAEQRTALSAPFRSAPTSSQEFTWNLRSAMGEFGAEIRASDQLLMNKAHHAYRVMCDFEEFWEALNAGEIDHGHTRAVVRHATSLEEDQLAEYSKLVLDYARDHTAPQTDRFASKCAARLTAAKFEEAHALEREQRRVVIEHGEQGMSTLWAYLPTVEATIIDDLLTQQARALSSSAGDDGANAAEGEGDTAEGDLHEGNVYEDTRTMDQKRADLLCDTLITATPQQILEGEAKGKPRVTASVSIVIPIMSLLDNPELDCDVATVNGMSPISGPVALDWARNAPHLLRILTDPITGHVVTVDTRMPDASLKRFLRARDVHCRFPGCRRPVERCDIDHTIAVEHGGPTSQPNLGHLCRRHHVQKHEKPWQLMQLPNGDYVWITPGGKVVTTQPEPPGPKFDPPPF
ncbi:HNH endonuclease signature motif containing protein [Gulosibacter massiliensis]|uniref:HNH endonuclease signature motif containing protein n=1 Tax=Gulosibacter massiliensis TaxID=2479839 RepID=UPI000F645088|nr:HNH endonuclease signature motif containing protein [Gulosibacter massiliensis]